MHTHLYDKLEEVDGGDDEEGDTDEQRGDAEQAHRMQQMGAVVIAEGVAWMPKIVETSKQSRRGHWAGRSRTRRRCGSSTRKRPGRKSDSRRIASIARACCTVASCVNITALRPHTAPLRTTLFHISDISAGHTPICEHI